MAYDDHYEVYIDGGLAVNETLSGSNFTVPLIALSYGVYNYTAVVYDESGEFAADTVIVTVIDIAPPTTDHPSDFEYEFGSSGNTIT